MEILDYRTINKGCLKSAFIISIPEYGGLQVEAAYFEKDDGSSWINLASKEYITRNGEKKSYSMARFDEKTSSALNKAVKEKIQKGQVTHKVIKQQAQATQQSFDENEYLPF
jgi:hypothetical protein